MWVTSWYFLTKVFKTEKGREIRSLELLCFFDNKGFNYINLSSILHLANVKDLFLEKLKIDEPPSLVYTLVKSISNKVF